MSIVQSVTDFHFLRPWFLLAIPLAWFVYQWLKHGAAAAGNWHKVIDPQLLAHLLQNPQQSDRQQRDWLAPLAALAWLLGCIALAGPSWQKVTLPVSQKHDAVVIVMDMSLSLYAEDEKPSRLTRSKRKAYDILRQREDGMTALIAYSGDAHLVVPLTDDKNTIINMLQALEPNIMPSFGNNIPAALALAQAQLDQRLISEGKIILLTDRLEERRFTEAIRYLDNPQQMSVITFGTRSGAPIPLQEGFLRDDNGQTVIARLNDREIHSMASKYGIYVQHNRPDNADIAPILASYSERIDTQRQQQADIWLDNGHWLVLLLLPLTLLAFRRGWLIAVMLFVFLPDHAYASLWQNSNQQAIQAFEQGDTDKAAQLFKHREWKGASLYRQGEFAKALDYFSDNTPRSLYNRGNTLAQLGRFEEAISAYEQVLAQQPDFADAAANKALLEELLKQQEQEQGQQDQQQNTQSKDQQEQQDSLQADSGDSSGADSTDTDQQMHNDTEQNAESQSDRSEDQQAKTDSEQEQNMQQPQQQTQEKEQAQADETKNLQQEAPDNKQQQQELEQWLRSVPNEPGRLLRNKFRYQYEQNRRQNRHIDRESEQPW